MGNEQFEKQVIQLLGQILETQQEHTKRFEVIESKLSEHDEKFNMIDKRFDTIENKLSKHDEKLDTITEQVAANTELTYTVEQLIKQVKRNTFDIDHLKDEILK